MTTMAQQLIAIDRILVSTIEEKLGNNLQWLYDQFDLEIRQRDQEVISRLKEIEEAWTLAARMKHQ
jgi:hypothetical protein